jgi:acyl carrier protein
MTTTLRRDDLGLDRAYVAPQSQLEERVAALWRDILKFDRVGVDDDFFDLGGDSLAAMALAAAVGSAFDIQFKSPQLMECNTVRRMVAEIGGNVRRPTNLVPARSAGSRPPLFMIHGQYGITFLPPPFMGGFHQDQPVYVFQVPGFDGGREPYDQVRDIAADYLKTMLEMQHTGPYLIAAFCAGSWIAVEMAKQMKQMGRAPDRLILMDPALHAAMDDEFLVNRGRISGGNVPLLSPLAASAKLLAADTFRRAKFFWRTGCWVNGQDHASFALPSVRKFWLDRQTKNLDHIDLDHVSGRGASQGEIGPSDRGPRPKESKALQAAAYASAKLQLAFRTYQPVPFEDHVDLIVSERTARNLENAAYPINRVLPNRRLIIFGKTHFDAVAGTESRNAEIIQQMLDETVASIRASDAAGFS